MKKIHKLVHRMDVKVLTSLVCVNVHEIPKFIKGISLSFCLLTSSNR